MRVVGTDAAACSHAAHLLTEMCSKGYSAEVSGGDFGEGGVEVPSRCIPDLIGSGGAVVRALRDACGVHVNFPPEGKRSADGTCQVALAGPKEGVLKAKGAIKDIVAKYYSPVTHPGMVHAEFKVDEWMIARFCGKAGSNVRHIQGDSKAKVYVPREWSENKNVIVVGLPKQVEVATKHVKRILEGIEEEAKRISSMEAMAASHNADKPYDSDDEPVEEWMNDYIYKR